MRGVSKKMKDMLTYVVTSTFWTYNDVTRKHEQVVKGSKWYRKPHYEIQDKVLLFNVKKQIDCITVSERLFSMCFELIQE